MRLKKWCVRRLRPQTLVYVECGAFGRLYYDGDVLFIFLHWENRSQNPHATRGMCRGQITLATQCLDPSKLAIVSCGPSCTCACRVHVPGPYGASELSIARLPFSSCPDHTKIAVRFRPWTCWGLCWEIDVGPPLFILLQPEMSTDGGVSSGWCGQPLLRASIASKCPSSFSHDICWGLCREIDVGPPLFTLLQLEMSTDDDGSSGQCDRPLIHAPITPKLPPGFSREIVGDYVEKQMLAHHFSHYYSQRCWRMVVPVVAGVINPSLMPQWHQNFCLVQAVEFVGDSVEK